MGIILGLSRHRIKRGMPGKAGNAGVFGIRLAEVSRLDLISGRGTAKKSQNRNKGLDFIARIYKMLV